ncbi:MAG: DUF368 domain-containing protein [Bacteroidales bacterium]|nr:DUF368 domain-containing protein [Bacteroidales bacterium]
MKNFIVNTLKGVAMGVANVIAGVSGGTIALIVGIFERLINSLKSFNFTAIKLLFTGKFKEFAKHTDFVFLFEVLLGIAVAMISVAKLFKYLFENYPTYIWALFFGLLIASIFYVGKTIKKWNLWVIVAFIIGIGVSLLIAFGTTAQENDNFFYLVLCGAIGSSGMILPGISGSYILVLMGDYSLVINAIDMLTKNPMEAMKVIAPVMIGVVVGIIAFAHVLAWIFKHYHDMTISLLTGFIVGSLPIIWPWKIYENGALPMAKDNILPEMNAEFFIAVAIIILGAGLIIATETIASRMKSKKEEATEDNEQMTKDN